MQAGLTKSDTDKLDEYFQGIRDIETRLSKTESWLQRCTLFQKVFMPSLVLAALITPILLHKIALVELIEAPREGLVMVEF